MSSDPASDFGRYFPCLRQNYERCCDSPPSLLVFVGRRHGVEELADEEGVLRRGGLGRAEERDQVERVGSGSQGLAQDVVDTDTVQADAVEGDLSSRGSNR